MSGFTELRNPPSLPGRVSFRRVLASGVLSILAGALISVPTFFVAILVSFSGNGSEWLLLGIGLATAIAIGAVSLARSLRRVSIALEPSIAVMAAGSLGLGVVAVGYGVVAIVGVIVGPGFFVLLAAETTAVVVWAAIVHQGVNRRVASQTSMGS